MTIISNQSTACALLLLIALCAGDTPSAQSQSQQHSSLDEMTKAAVAEAEVELLRARSVEMEAAQEQPLDWPSLVQDTVASDPSARSIGDGAILSSNIVKAFAKRNDAKFSEALEAVQGRSLPDCPYDVAPCDPEAKYRTIDGSCNNLLKMTRGMASSPQLRLLPPIYGNGVDSMRVSAGNDALPNARLVANKMMNEEQKDHRSQTVATMHFGQFLDHDITKTPVSTLSNVAIGQPSAISCGDDGCDPDFHPACQPITYPEHDPVSEHRRCIKFVRSQQVPNIECEVGPAEHLNTITSFIDGSAVYGSSQQLVNSLRDSNTTRGQMATSSINGEVFPPTSGPLTCVESAHCFQAGDVRANVQNGLTALHTLFVREHNRIEAALHDINPQWDGETLFQETRKIIGAQLQHITYNEYLPSVLGEAFTLAPLPSGTREYDPNVDPSILNEFSTAAYRFGHSLIPNTVKRADQSYDLSSYPPIILSDMMLRTDAMSEGGLDAFFRGMIEQPSSQSGCAFANQARNHLFAADPPHGFGGDLAALNIQRGRDHGLPGYLEYRRHCELPVGNSIREFPGIKPFRRHRLNQVYTDKEDVDLFAGGMAEAVVRKGAVGPTFACIITEQFRRLRDGDRFFYENRGVFTKEQLAEIRKTRLSKMMCDNGENIQNIQPNVFLKDGGPTRGSPIPNYRASCDTLPSMDLTKWRQ